MIDLSKFQIFLNNIAKLKETSFDSSGGGHYMTESMLDVIAFDGVKTEYIKELGLEKAPRSNDALFNDNQGLLTFVEFKNGSIGRREVSELKEKIYDSVLILMDITKTRISELRENAVYIMVYNSDRIIEESESPGENIQESASYNTIAQSVTKLAGRDLIEFGLHPFEKFCFKNVYTFSQDKFEEYLTEHNPQGTANSSQP